MITDQLLQLASQQAVTASAVSQNTVELATVARDIGAGEPLYLCITVDDTATAAGAATVDFAALTSANQNLTTTQTLLATTGPIPVSELTAGRKPIYVPIPANNLSAFPIGRRYFGAGFTVATGPLTAGKFTVNVVHDRQDVGKHYPSGYTVA